MTEMKQPMMTVKVVENKYREKKDYKKERKERV